AAPAVASADGLGARGYSLTGTGTALLSYDLAAPTTPTTTAITGVAAGDTLVGVAVRPQTADLYAVGINPTADTIQVYHLGARTGFATPVGTAGGFVNATGTPIDFTDVSYGVAFNPSVDRIRVVNSSGLNLRLNPNSGAPVDGDLGGPLNSVSGVNPDGSINGAPSVHTTAYVNRRQSVTTTTQYTLSAETDSLYIQAPPNAGTQTAPVALKLGGNPLNVAGVSGLDFMPAVSTAAANAPATGKAYATLLGAGETQLATIDLASGDVTLLGKVGDGSPVRGLAIQGEEVAGGIPAVALSDATLKRFNTATPGTLTSVNLGAPATGDTIVNITRRPQTGQFYAVGVNAIANTATLYILDPQLGGLTQVGAGNIAFVENDGVTPIDLPDPDTTFYGVDVNPTVDRIRVVTGSGLNLRLNPVTGGAVDSNPAAGTGINPDGPINGLPGGSTGVTGTSYTNAFARDLLIPGAPTTQYTLDPSSNSLFIQNPPNNGTQTAQKALTLGGAPLDFDQRLGFDIPSDVTVETANVPAVGKGFAALTVGGVPGLYTVDLTTGAATLIGALGTAPIVDGLVIGDRSPAFVPPVVVPPTTPTPPTTPPVTPPVVDPKPTLSGLKLTPTSFRVTKRPKGASTKVKTGSTISFTVSELSTVSFTFERVETGRLSGGTCKKQTSKNRKAKSCQRSVTVGNLKVTAPAGQNSVKFNGKVNGSKTLSRASYRITAIAMDTAKQKSGATSARFKVVR
ncbi:MAG: DUF4394 domain-containing protein, partial [Solirubrobacteraceae bacterium]|nr:DUF4394 domain-containing protein [Solirubrobacteraceae bacterium]